VQKKLLTIESFSPCIARGVKIPLHSSPTRFSENNNKKITKHGALRSTNLLRSFRSGLVTRKEAPHLNALLGSARYPRAPPSVRRSTWRGQRHPRSTVSQIFLLPR
jgi:hypothetical protein